MERALQLTPRVKKPGVLLLALSSIMLLSVMWAGCSAPASSADSNGTDTPIVAHLSVTPDVPPVTDKAVASLTFDDILKDYRQLVENEKARTHSQYIHPETFAESKELQAYLQSIKGQKVYNWRGWVVSTGNWQLGTDANPYYTVSVNMAEPKDDGICGHYVELIKVAPEQMQKLWGPYLSAREQSGLKLIEFSGSLWTVWCGNVSLEDVRLEVIDK